ncbi:uncharacterized protein LOC129756589 [Uranotaenia lowii]|uniref:uncharacterized protein LOC129756589 n=1 Tax=Uranotaenia lowii TaxID=190385 RepID=UPI00247B09C7|nr:uncharacterized protein LOC129756589 [Uranotaenia lowii]
MFASRHFRQIGFTYAILCFLGSFFVTIHCLKQFVQSRGDESFLLPAAGTVIFLFSAFFSLLIKLGVDEIKPPYIRAQKVYMLIRNLILAVFFTCQSVAWSISENAKSIEATGMLLVVSASVGLEMWIIEGVQSYVDERYSRERLARSLRNNNNNNRQHR